MNYSHWRTTALGVISIIAAIANAAIALLNGQHVDWVTTGSAISAGLGLVAAADAKNV